MYRQILIDPNQRDLQRIMWKTSADAPVKTYKLATVTYGTVSALFLATWTLRALADEEKAEFPDAADVICNDSYMDDILSGESTLEGAKKLQTRFSQLLQRGGFELHKWVSNSPELLKDLSASSYVFDKEFQDAPVKTLGMLWDPKVDCITYKVKISDKVNFSKRDVLSEIARLYDLLGLIGPIVTKAKIFIQELWKIKLDWSEQLPPDAMEEWMNFYQKLAKVNNFKIPRCILLPATIRIEIHGFSVASERAYADVVYIKCFNESGQSQTRLLCSKSRVAPLKTLTIPRLELSAALLLSRLVKKVVPILQLSIHKIWMWTDSTIALAWIKTEPHKLKTFVSNRVAEIQALSKDYHWKHVSSKNNPADLISRGCNVDELLKNEMWFSGPDLQTDEYEDNQLFPDPSYRDELKCAVTLSMTECSSNFYDELFNVTNNFIKLIRISSFIFRFINNIKAKESCNKEKYLTADEVKRSTEFLAKIAQLSEFKAEIDALKKVPLSDNINEYEVLTPGHFIIGRPISAIPEPAILDISDNRLSRWQYTTKCVQTIWKRWKNDYLNHLQQRNKWQFEKNNVAVGCLVLLKENDLPPCKWAMARILEVISGTDAKGRRRDLLELAETLGITIQDNFKILDIKDAILNSEGYDAEFTCECLNRIISDRKEIELRAEREKENQRQFELQKFQIATNTSTTSDSNMPNFPSQSRRETGIPSNSRRNPISKDRIPEKKIVDTKEDRTPVSCYGCGAPGIIRSRCHTCNSVRQKDDALSSSLNQSNFYSFSSESNPISIIQISICNTEAAVCADTGATHSVAGEKLYHLLKQKGLNFEEKTMQMTLADGHTQTTEILTTSVDISIQGKVIPTELLILKNARGNRTFLGIDFLTAAGIVLDLQRKQWYFTETSHRKYNFVKAPPNINALLTVDPEPHLCQLRKNEGTHLSLPQWEELNSLLEQYEECFQPGGEPTPFIEHRINTRNHLPVAVPPYRMNPSKKEILKQEINRLLSEGIIEECARFKATKQKPASLLRTPVYSQRFEVIAIDLFGPLPQTNTVLINVQQLIEEVFMRHGIPRRIISDNGTQFVSAVLQQICFTLNISQNLIPVYSPQSNPVERKNRDLKPRLAILVGDDHSSWYSKLPVIRFAMNTTVCDTTGHTPAYLLFGRELRTVDDVVQDFKSVVHNDNFVAEITPYLK
ncbi:integrase catalytic domain-containing protein [Trichonephila clavipes]|nr:integrase catalytic domain-containing protein [Trichonephila clavipes]